MNSVLSNRDLIAHITAFQTGSPVDLHPFHHFVHTHYVDRGRSPRHTSVCPNFLLPRDPDFLHLQLQAFGAVFAPWYATRTTGDIPRLLATSDKLPLVLLHWAIANDRVDVFHYLHAALRIPSCLHVTAIAAYWGSLPVIKYLHETNSTGFLSYTMEWAAKGGHVDVVEFLHFHRTEGCSVQAMNLAARFGHLNVVKFLHAHRTEGCTTHAMDQAAHYGHFDVVRFLHDHRTEGCTTHAMDYASSNGHLDIVKFLHFHRTEGATTTAMVLAACGGHLDVLKFLHTHRSEGCTHRAIESAAENKRYDVCLFLAEHRPNDVDRSNMTVSLGLSMARLHKEKADRDAKLAAAADAIDAPRTVESKVTPPCSGFKRLLSWTSW